MVSETLNLKTKAEFSKKQVEVQSKFGQRVKVIVKNVPALAEQSAFLRIRHGPVLNNEQGFYQYQVPVGGETEL